MVAISLSKGEGVEAPKLNPTFADDDFAYSEGLKTGIKLIGDIVGKRERADQLIDYAFAQRKLVEDRVASIPDGERVRLYMANPDMNTYGSGKYTGVIMKRSGGVNVAAGVRGATKVSMEDVLAWNPQVIFVQDRYAPVADEIRKGAAWQHLDAVENKPPLHHAGICEALGLSAAGGAGSGRIVDGEEALSRALRRYRHAEAGRCLLHAVLWPGLYRPN